ncbi:MAG: hypothetical protein ACE5FZ_06040 [Nitrospiria bacterium]
MFRKILASLILPFMLAMLSASIAEAKPRPPLRLSLRHQSLSGGEIQLRFEAKANVGSDQVTLSIDLPPGVFVLEGEADWEGSLEKGETRKIIVIISDPGEALQEIRGRADIQFSTGGSFSQESGLRLKNSKKEGFEFHKPFIRKEGGETTLEFRGK